ncbi:MAG: hypothetical protein JWN46_1671 [Acidimicrobiales bacterium]|nr:hypothetical protein [Acidimicrobiales bacterium]
MAALAGIAATTLGTVPARAVTTTSADLSITATHNPSSPLGGTNLTFTLTAHNDGPDPAKAVLVAMSSGFPLRFGSASGPAGTCTNSQATGSVICKVGDIASGASASVQVVVTPLASGVYQVPYATSSETPDPDTADRAGVDTVIVQKGPSQAERYVPAVFQLLLGRGPGADAAFWVKMFTAQRYRSLYEVPLGIMSSAEYRRIRVNEAYTRILGRSPSSGDLSYWSGRIGQGLSYAGLEVRLVASPEFVLRRSSGIAEKAVAAVFRAILRRTPTATESRDWGALLQAGFSQADLAMVLVTSTEGRDLVLFDRYQRTLGRAPSPLERYFWLSEAQKGASPEVLWAGVLAGYEYTNKFPPTYNNCCPSFPKPAI